MVSNLGSLFLSRSPESSGEILYTLKLGLSFLVGGRGYHIGRVNRRPFIRWVILWLSSLLCFGPPCLVRLKIFIVDMRTSGVLQVVFLTYDNILEKIVHTFSSRMS